MGCLLGQWLYHIVSVTSTGHLWLAFHGVGKPGVAMVSGGGTVPSAQIRRKPWSPHMISLTHTHTQIHTIDAPLGFQASSKAKRSILRWWLHWNLRFHKRFLNKCISPKMEPWGMPHLPISHFPCSLANLPCFNHPRSCQQQQVEGTAALGHQTRWEGEV